MAGAKSPSTVCTFPNARSTRKRKRKSVKKRFRRPETNIMEKIAKKKKTTITEEKAIPKVRTIVVTIAVQIAGQLAAQIAPMSHRQENPVIAVEVDTVMRMKMENRKNWRDEIVLYKPNPSI